MAKTGILGQSKPAAATDTLLYEAPIDASASAVLRVSNDGTGAAYSVGVKPYAQQFTLDANTYKFHKGDVITNYKFTLDVPIASGDLTAGTALEADDAETGAIFESYVIPDVTTIYVKAIALQSLTLEGVSGNISVGDTVTAGTSPDLTTADVYDVYTSGANTIVWIGPQTLATASSQAFADADPLVFTSGGSATIASGGILTPAQNHYIFSTTTAGGTYGAYILQTGDPNGLFTVFNDRVYRFDVSDSSMSGRDFKISDTINGEWGPDGDFAAATDNGVEYTAGKTTNGTAGTAGAYVQYDFTGSTLGSVFYYYDGGTGTAANSSYGGTAETGARGINLSGSPTFDEIYVYNVTGTWTNNVSSFTAENTSYTVTAQSSGKYGYVKRYEGTTLEICLGINSDPFVATDTFLDVPLDAGDTRSLATISSVDVDVAALEAKHYVVQGKTLAANTQEAITSLVVGPGEYVIVNSATQNNSFTMVGFEDSSSDITVNVASDPYNTP